MSTDAESSAEACSEDVAESGLSQPAAPRSNVDSLSDRLRAVRHQLTRGRRLASAFGTERASPSALRAAERLEAAVRWLDEAAPPPRTMRGLNDTAELPWLVRVIEHRAGQLERALQEPPEVPKEQCPLE